MLDARLTISTERRLKNESAELTHQNRMVCRAEGLAAVLFAICLSSFLEPVTIKWGPSLEEVNEKHIWQSKFDFNEPLTPALD